MTNNKYHTLTVEETIRGLGSHPKAGLSSSEAGIRLSKYGRNKIAAKSGISPWRILADQFKPSDLANESFENPTDSAKRKYKKLLQI